MQLGFVTGLILAIACLALSAYYLLSFERHANSAVEHVLASATRSNTSANQLYVMQFSLSVHMAIARTLLLSCGVFAGLSFGFLGFSLFLIGVDGAINAELQGRDAVKVSAAGLAPGAFVILCASVLIAVCARGSLPAKVEANGFVTDETQRPSTVSEDRGREPAVDEVDRTPPEQAPAK